VGSEKAYQRSDLLEPRRKLMAEWERFGRLRVMSSGSDDENNGDVSSQAASRNGADVTAL